ncbi:MAG: ATP synthase F1 subunit epsilon [Eubacterium sp.]|jgi:F-type H+-transporting ATPase subunit epsilon|nr:ATP synthase F1 subunit epsilon [Eubacterium sp.]
MNMTPFRLQIITPDKVFFDGMSEGVILRTTVGDKGILANHEPYAAALVIGQMRVNIDGKYRTAAISAGAVKVSLDKTVILTQSCEWSDEIDVTRAERAKAESEERIKNQKLGEREMNIAEFKLKRALNRIETAGK